VLEGLSRLPLYMLFRSIGRPKLLPMSLTVSVTSACNSRCKTCRIYETRYDQMSIAQYGRLFQSLGRTPLWVTLSGGEPFLREDLPEICAALYSRCRPAVINIPTNGILHQKIAPAVQTIATSCSGARVVVNLSLDAVGDMHDEIRGVPGNFEKALNTYNNLKGLQARGVANLSLGIHTVISRFNVASIPRIVPELLSLHPDSYITEIAENRVELETMNLEITPEPAAYQAAIDFITERMRTYPFRKLGRVIRALRLEYYQHVKALLFGKSARWPCYAGFASAQIMPDGQVWACCISGQLLGHLAETEYDFRRVWFSSRADEVRQAIKESRCQCPLANSSYTNMLLHPPTLLAIGARALALR
jgi:MoaA/NifB/PqqE/SkfB family radical SAM enzyme